MKRIVEEIDYITDRKSTETTQRMDKFPQRIPACEELQINLKYFRVVHGLRGAIG